MKLIWGMLLLLPKIVFATSPVYVHYDGFFLENCNRQTVSIQKLSWNTGDQGATVIYEDGGLYLAPGAKVFFRWSYTNYTLPRFEIFNSLKSKACFRYQNYQIPESLAYSCGNSRSGYSAKIQPNQESGELFLGGSVIGNLICSRKPEPLIDDEVLSCATEGIGKAYQVTIRKVGDSGAYLGKITQAGIDRDVVLNTLSCASSNVTKN